jgi:hypothetical protein
MNSRPTRRRQRSEVNDQHSRGTCSLTCGRIRNLVISAKAPPGSTPSKGRFARIGGNDRAPEARPSAGPPGLRCRSRPVPPLDPGTGRSGADAGRRPIGRGRPHAVIGEPDAPLIRASARHTRLAECRGGSCVVKQERVRRSRGDVPRRNSNRIGGRMNHRESHDSSHARNVEPLAAAASLAGVRRPG